MTYKERCTIKSLICASLQKTHSEVCSFAFALDPQGRIVSTSQNAEAVHR